MTRSHEREESAFDGRDARPVGPESGLQSGSTAPPVSEEGHLGAETIQNILEGIIPIDETSAIARHLEQCTRCQNLVKTLTSASGVTLETVTRTLAAPVAGLAPLAPGTVVDHFVVERLVGRGGMGEVYLARDDTLGRPVALKLISPSYLGSLATRRQFEIEARTTARFNHPNIVAIYAVGEHGGRPYMALEYLEGETLREYMARTVPGAEAAIRLGLPIARALAEAHKHGVLHRDLKPVNIMLPEDGRLRVLDFGLAKGVVSTGEDAGTRMEEFRVTATGLRTLAGGRSETVRTRFLGTPAYMAPEQWREEPVGPATDVWAFGLILYQLVTGRRPYHGIPLQEIPKAVTGPDPVPSVAQVARHLPEDLAALIDQCLRKDPKARPSSAEAAVRLEALQARLDAGTSEKRGKARDGTRDTRESGRDVPGEGGRAIDGASRRLSGQRTFRTGWKAPLLGLVLAATIVIAGSRMGREPVHVPPPGPPVLIGLYPASPGTDASAELAPLLRYLEDRLARAVKVEVAPSYRALREGLETGSYDFGMLPPTQYVLARHEQPSLVPVAYTEYDSVCQGFLVVPTTSTIETLEDLKGKRICYVDRGSTSGYLVPRLYLRKHGLDPDTLFSGAVFSGAHIETLTDLLDGRCDVAAVYSEAYLRAYHVDKRFPSEVEILAVTGNIPSDILCASPRTSPDLISSVRDTLLQFSAPDVLGTTSVSDVYPYTITDFKEPSDDIFADVEKAARLEGVLQDLPEDASSPGQ